MPTPDQYTLLLGDCLETLKTIEPYSVACCITSPPYYGLRDYGTASWEGGIAECDHKAPPAGGTGESSKLQVMQKRVDFVSGFYKDICGKCGAIRIDSQIGLEESPEQYVEKLVQVFREVRRVLQPDGTLWINLGDSYVGSANTGGNGKRGDGGAPYKISGLPSKKGNGLKPKDLIGIPWLVAFALRADGWYLRSEIIWHKPNPMPESVTDRPTKSHEQIFLLSKSAQYFYDAEAILEPATGYDGRKDTKVNGNSNHKNDGETFAGREHERWRYKNLQYTGQKTRSMHEKRLQGEEYMSPVRNKRSVWTVSTKPYAGAHFATFPPKLIEPCILAGSHVGDIVLDPFNGSGTTGAVAIKHHRKYIGCELNSDYITLTKRRLSQVQYVLFEANS